MSAPASGHAQQLAEVYAILRGAAARAREEAAASEPPKEGPATSTTSLPAE